MKPGLKSGDQRVLNTWVCGKTVIPSFLLEKKPFSCMCAHSCMSGVQINVCLPSASITTIFLSVCFEIWRQGLSLGLELLAQLGYLHSRPQGSNPPAFASTAGLADMLHHRAKPFFFCGVGGPGACKGSTSPTELSSQPVKKPFPICCHPLFK